MRLLPPLTGVLLLAVILAPDARAADPLRKVDYNRDVRPILADACFSCHGPDEKQRKAKLRLDTREGLLGALRDGGHAVVPGKLNQSELWARVSSSEPDGLMPPVKSGKSLKPQQKELLKRWIEQ